MFVDKRGYVTYAQLIALDCKRGELDSLSRTLKVEAVIDDLLDGLRRAGLSVENR